MTEGLRDALTNPHWLLAWAALVVASLGVLIHDLRTRNPEIMSLMRWVWLFTVAYSGPLGLAVYFYSGRKQIARDSIWRRGCRSVAHCYSGCGAGEIVGVSIAAGFLSLGNLGIGLLTFALAYVAGFGMTVGPLLQEGVGLRQALWDAVTSETASITVMELTAIGVDLWLAANARFGEPLFWSSLVVSLTAGLVAAYPVNVLLLRFGVKSAMHSPRDVARSGGRGG